MTLLPVATKAASAVVVFVSLLFIADEASAAEKRLALLIGNKSYQPSIGALANTVNDVKLLAEALGKVRFAVDTVEDAGRRKILSSVLAFVEKLRAAGPDAVEFFSTIPGTACRGPMTA